MNKFYFGAKVAATIAIFALGLYYSVVQPGPMDFVDGAVNGLVVYAIWFARERTK